MIDLISDLINDLPQIDVDEISEAPMTRFPGTEPNFGLRHSIMMNAILHTQGVEEDTK
jgi:hypothetical protein